MQGGKVGTPCGARVGSGFEEGVVLSLRRPAFFFWLPPSLYGFLGVILSVLHKFLSPNALCVSRVFQLL